MKKAANNATTRRKLMNTELPRSMDMTSTREEFSLPVCFKSVLGTLTRAILVTLGCFLPLLKGYFFFQHLPSPYMATAQKQSSRHFCLHIPLSIAVSISMS
ncbi:hypothetical protein Fmac_025566 [Flemingia macrophylla]|uniref:Uncharacterized protein n=1 Tax=Flemingia macrophylla TaxID=520843 RepID=A0ABD1LT69_9FABA